MSLRFLRTELIVDSFAGGGGASKGIEMALGRCPDIAINHDPQALVMHEANHPATRHYCESVWDVDPVRVCAGRPVGLAWFSPDCCHHSKAKGGKPRNQKIRGLAWVAVRWAAAVRPRVICLENVEEFEHWGPLHRSGPQAGTPIRARRGETFRAFVRKLERLGYAVEWRQLRACDYGAPTIRKRLFLVARCDGAPIVWPEPTHGPGLVPYQVAADIIDWSLPCPSIFERRRPLADKTLARIARGIRRFVLEAAEPYIVPVDGQLAAPTLVTTGYGEREGQAPRAPGLHVPHATVVAGGGKSALVAAFLAKHYGGHETPGAPLEAPISTITARDHHALVTSHLVKLMGSCRDGQATTEPLPTIRAQGNHVGEVRAFLTKYYRRADGSACDAPLHTVTSKPRFGLVTVRGGRYEIADIGMRMLSPRELYRAQGFPDDYQIDLTIDGRRLSKEAQVRMAGNSVPPLVATALVRANFAAQVAGVPYRQIAHEA